MYLSFSFFRSMVVLKSSCLSDHSSSDESGDNGFCPGGDPVTSPPVSSPTSSSLMAAAACASMGVSACSGSSASNSKQGSPRGSTLHIPTKPSRPQLRIRARKQSNKSTSGGKSAFKKSSAASASGSVETMAFPAGTAVSTASGEASKDSV